MLQQLINHSPDIKKLQDEGYDLEIMGGQVNVHRIPYVNAKSGINYGTMVTVLTYATPTKVGLPQDHTIYFIGETPCDRDGKPLTAIINNSNNQQLTEKILINHYFSSKPKGGNYGDYYEKISTYAAILLSHAHAVDDTLTARPGQLKEIESGGDVFMYPDTNSARSKIEYLNRKFRNLKIGIIGMGGTGAYILDLVSKTRVKEIHIFDKDVFQIHNAFRSPGTMPVGKLDEGVELRKVNYYAEIYSRMHRGVVPHDEYVTKENIHELSDFDFVFISVDTNEARHIITNGLLCIGVTFIDAGLGVNLVNDSLLGTLRITTVSESKHDHLKNRIGAIEFDENEYSTNIQIADLNCLNATLAVIKWKKLVSFYQDLKQEHNTLYFINTGKIINEDFTA